MFKNIIKFSNKIAEIIKLSVKKNQTVCRVTGAEAGKFCKKQCLEAKLGIAVKRDRARRFRPSTFKRESLKTLFYYISEF